jgi:rSAM/selenodomain-associated transferase 1
VVAAGLICVFAKPPLPGQVKTRLAARWGEAHAAALAEAFVQDTWRLVTSVTWAEAILATTGGEWCDLAGLGSAEVWLQGDGDLGERLERMARAALARADFVLLVGADSPGLPPLRLERAREALSEADAVLGPCDDGGFYLLGLRRCPPRLLAGLPWSAPETFAATRERLAAHGLEPSIIDGWFDVDVPEDLERLRSGLESGLLDAPRSAELLRRTPPAGPCTT